MFDWVLNMPLRILSVCILMQVLFITLLINSMIISVSTIYEKSRAEANVFQKHLPEVFSIREQLPLALSKTCQTLAHVRPILH